MSARERLEGRVSSAGPRFCFVRDGAARDWFVDLGEILTSATLRVGDRVTFEPSVARDGKRFACRVRLAGRGN